MQHEKQFLEQLLAPADIKINGDRPFDIQVRDDRLYHRLMAQWRLGFGESYMDGWWECEQLDEMISHIMLANIEQHIRISPQLVFYTLKAVLTNTQRRAKAFEVGEKHYDVGNDLYSAMLDKRMTYTCGYWKDAQNLDEAQEAKLDLVCRKIGLKSGQKVLDIGSGWGSFAKFAAEKYGAHVVGVTVSKEQLALASERCQGLPVEFRFQDYRELKEENYFDHVISLGMFEHVGKKNYRDYMKVVHRVLKDDGFFLLHTIGGNKSVHGTDPWIDKYIFPNSMLPSIEQLGKAFAKLFVMEDWHNFGPHYDKTLMAWMANVDAHWPALKEKYGERFYRMWRYFLLASAGSFRGRKNQLWQIVLTKHGAPGGYTSVR